jgi:Sulfotransferase family
MGQSFAMQIILEHYPFWDARKLAARLRYSTFVNVADRYLYFAIPKAACTSMKLLLRELHGAPPIQLYLWPQRETRRDMFVHARQNVPLPSILDLDNMAQREVLESSDFLRMTVVRNPYTLLLSAWRNKVLLCEPGFEYIYRDIKGGVPCGPEKSLVSFDEFVDYIGRAGDSRTRYSHWQRQVDRVFFKAMNFTHVGKVEDTARTMQHLRQHLGLSEPLRLPHSNRSANSPSVTFTLELADKIFALYAEDFATFGYDKDVWPEPRPDARGAISDDHFYDEIIERNLIITELYRQTYRFSLARIRDKLRRIFGVRNGYHRE